MQNKSLKLDILSPEKELYSGEAVLLTVKAEDGELSVMADHAPLITILSKGPIRFKKTDGLEIKIDAGKGLLKVFNNQASVLI
jgi:F-type H+-transporting ATPase subunit epsilon